eukprot:Polyplicarium_translucidae@DN2726_c0_g1_i1.p1
MQRHSTTSCICDVERSCRLSCWPFHSSKRYESTRKPIALRCDWKRRPRRLKQIEGHISPSFRRPFPSPSMHFLPQTSDSFFTCNSSESSKERLSCTASTDAEEGADLAEHAVAEKKLCTCGFESHVAVHDPKIPIMPPPGELSALAEALHVSRPMCGHWVTMLDRSNSMDEQYKAMGVAYYKRVVMNRLAVQLTVFLEKDDTVLHIHVHTPLGIRHMLCNITGAEFQDSDPDCGVWYATAKVVDFTVPWFCNGKPVRALQQQRYNPRCGRIVESRCVLPDKAQGRVLLLNFRMYPNSGEERVIVADRVLKLVQ